MIEQIKQALSLEAAWAEYASSEWINRGKTNCPLPDHEDSTPSCMIYGERWWCFGCNRGGDAIDLVAYAQFRGDTRAAVNHLRQQLGIRRLGVGVVLVRQEQSPESLFSQASDQAYFEVLDKLKADFDFENILPWTVGTWDWFVSRYMDRYDVLIEAVDNGLPIERAMDYLLAWRLWALGRVLDNRNRKLVNLLRGGDFAKQERKDGVRGRKRSRAERARLWLARGA